MKRAWMLGAATAVMFAVGCSNGKPELAEDFSDLQNVDEKSDQFSKKMSIVGSLDYGQTSGRVKYHNPPRYRAFKFAGHKGDEVTIDVASANGDSYAWLVDNDYKVIAKNDDVSRDVLDSHLEAKLPGNRNPDIVTYYIIFTEFWGDDATFYVSLKKKQNGQFCGGIAGIQCPAGQECVDNPNDGCDPARGGADCGGICQPVHCGGIAARPCPSGSKCVDDPNDSCDPNHGGADCGGICVQCVQNQACIRGSHWDAAQCSCVPDAPADCSVVLCAQGTTCVNSPGGARCLAPGQVCAF